MAAKIEGKKAKKKSKREVKPRAKGKEENQRSEKGKERRQRGKVTGRRKKEIKNRLVTKENILNFRLREIRKSPF